MPRAMELAFKKQLDNIIAEISEEVIAVQHKLVEEVYNAIVDESPIHSGYYASNHRITIRQASGQFGSGGAQLVPLTRPDDAEIGKFLDNIPRTRAQEVAKIPRMKLGDTAEISTLVPYANQIEQRRPVYTKIGPRFGLRVK